MFHTHRIKEQTFSHHSLTVKPQYILFPTTNKKEIFSPKMATTISSLVPKSLMNVLVAPTRISTSMNKGLGKRSVVSLNIHKDRIGVAVASQFDVNSLPSIPTKGRLLNGDECTEQLRLIAEEHNVCGFLVAWPIQKDTGKMGASCGRVLFTLDTLLKQSESPFSTDRPICLWDCFKSENTRLPVDEFGRCSAFGQPSEETLHLASKEQYDQAENVTAAGLWEDFCKFHLPEVSRRTARARKIQKNRGSGSHNLVSDWKKYRASQIAATL